MITDVKHESCSSGWMSHNGVFTVNRSRLWSTTTNAVTPFFPVSSQIVLTKSAGGNDAASLFNATSTNLLGIFVSPALILMFFGSTGALSTSQRSILIRAWSASVPFAKVIVNLVISVLVPLVLGQITQVAALICLSFALILQHSTSSRSNCKNENFQPHT